MKDRYRMFRRSGGTYYARDSVTLNKESLRTTDLAEAKRIVAAKNQAVAQPQLNVAMAKAYLTAKSPEMCTRTWTDVMDRYVQSGVESTRERKERAFRSKPFAMLRKTKLVDTEADHLFAALDHKSAGTSTHHYLKRLHNFALHLGWILNPVMADAAWPPLRHDNIEALSEAEHLLIVGREFNEERRNFYELLWHTGGAQSDIANLSWKDVDQETNTIRFSRRKLAGRSGGSTGGSAGSTCLCIGTQLTALMAVLPQTGYFFPRIRLEQPKHRAAEFKRRCKVEAERKRHPFHSVEDFFRRVSPNQDEMQNLLRAGFAGGLSKFDNSGIPFG
jgi:integrase